MLSIRSFSAAAISHFRQQQSHLPFTYSEVGATNGTLPTPYVVDHTRVELGFGEEVFNRARRALQQWQQFELGWVQARPSDTPIRAGETVGVSIRFYGVWWLNAARIVYVTDESNNAAARFGFAYGTLPGHAESGEERFLIEWDRDSDRVSYDILAFSRPRHFLARLAKWQVRRLQKRFARCSAEAMLKAVSKRA
jgi:uncharacterized protein (UPF0548 family)